MENSKQHNQSVWRSLLEVIAVILLFLVCLCGLILSVYGSVLVMFPPFGPILLGAGLAILASGIVLLRMLLRRL
jgi:hypothetical protein